MARGVNKVILIGHLGADPEMKYTPNGTPVCTFRVATNEAYRDSSGQWQERTEWHRVVAWAKLAERCGQYLSKGRQVYVEGTLRTRSWEDREGNRRYTTEIVARDVQFLGGPGTQPAAEPLGPEPGGFEEPLPGPPPPDDDIPF